MYAQLLRRKSRLSDIGLQRPSNTTPTTDKREREKRKTSKLSNPLHTLSTWTSKRRIHRTSSAHSYGVISLGSLLRVLSDRRRIRPGLFFRRFCFSWLLSVVDFYHFSRLPRLFVVITSPSSTPPPAKAGQLQLQLQLFPLHHGRPRSTMSIRRVSPTM